MSYQFQPANDPNSPFGSPPPTVQQPATPFAPAPAPGRHPGLIAAGLLIMAAGIAAGVVMILASGKNYDESVQNLARAPIGCTTSLRFDQTGTFTIYVETKGTIGDVRGDCPNADDIYDSSGGDLPDADIELTNDDGDSVDLTEDTSTEYDAGDAIGHSVASVRIDETGDYDITVTSDDQDFAIAVGKDPKGDADSLRTNGIVAIAAGVVLGAVLLLLGLRRKSPKTPTTAAYSGAPPQPPAPPGPPSYQSPPSPPSHPGSSPPGSSQPWVPGPITPAPPTPGWPPAAPTSPPGPPRLNPPNWPAPPPTS